ncbi:hypothetical protein N7931_17525 [Catenovulum sp. 2E275]|uniref:hypothetical protein n=1 Tax=Catenovulum sp. 2E275 TaxID=2980497 RepID=UPI0021D047C5|nr:hypothetical protein [Catenovulum sp. 2E275]MCU4677427.1 hypothetical protein [Catenovulum sp. 2E275]
MNESFVERANDTVVWFDLCYRNLLFKARLAWQIASLLLAFHQLIKLEFARKLIVI